MSDILSAEVDHCRELAMPPGSVFEFTGRFLSASELQPVLALYALRQAITTIPYLSTDDSVKWAKLKWWSDEILADPTSPSRHPILRVLQASGARARLSDSMLQLLISDTITQIDTAPVSDEKAWFERNAALGSTEIKLELTLAGVGIEARDMEFLGAAMNSYRLISGFAADNRSGVHHLPLSILAKYNVGTTQLEQNLFPAQFSSIVMQLIEQTLDWYSEGISRLSVAPNEKNGKHLRLRWAMEKRRLARIRKNMDGFLQSGHQFGPSDAWFAWRFLRKLRE
jgi:phytoene/squalene synthetase